MRVNILSILGIFIEKTRQTARLHGRLEAVPTRLTEKLKTDPTCAGKPDKPKLFTDE